PCTESSGTSPRASRQDHMLYRYVRRKTLDNHARNEYSFITSMALPRLNDEASPKREAILEAALELFAERGFHGTAVPLVAERAQVGAGTLYRYFTSKEALVNALFQQWKAALFQALTADFPTDAPPRQQFHELWQRLGRF